LSAWNPSLAVGLDGTVHVAWEDYTTLPPDADPNYDIFYKKYVPGTGWTTTQVVSTESTLSAYYPSLAVGLDGTVHVAWRDYTTLPPDADAATDIFYKKNVLSPVEPLSLSDLVEFPGLTHLRDLQGSEKTSKYTEIQTTVEGYSTIKTLLESKGYTFTGDYNISIVQGTIDQTPFSGALYSHWSSLASDGTRALLVAAKMDDGVDTMFGAIANLLPSQLRPPAGYIITNAMPYMYLEFYLWDKANSRTASWSYWWYDSHSHPNWYWALYYWWRTYTKQYYSWYYYRPWWYIWHWLYWKHWNWWSTQFPY